jgi:NAD(P)-binding Rossmann-like domain
MTHTPHLAAVQAKLRTDYLIVGSGAVGMAFADTLFHETDCSMVIVDRHHGPGGHWNDAYPFVRLHQPSAFYGVNSKPLGANGKDVTGLNVGMYERATSAELVSYYEQLMQMFVASGRVQYFPMSDYVGDWHDHHRFVSLLSKQTNAVTVAKKIVNTTHLNTAVPSTHPPKYAIAQGVRCVPLNVLPTLNMPLSGYVVVGAGKTGVDACLWLLENGASPDSITWIMPRDAWFQNRAKVQPGSEFFMESYGSFADQMEIVANASSPEEVYAKLEAGGHWLRLDKTVEPSMYHGALMSQLELDLLAKIKNVVRMGRIVRIEKTQVVLEQGVIASDADRLYVDCSASAVQFSKALDHTPVFTGNLITPQFVRTFQPTFSAALVAHIEAQSEAHLATDEAKNELCHVIPMPDKPLDWLRMHAVNLRNQYRWSKNKSIRAWIAKARLDGFTALAMRTRPWQWRRLQVLRRFGMNAGPAAVNLKKLLAHLEPMHVMTRAETAC